MKQTSEKQAVAGLDRDLLATYMRNKMAEENLSLRKAAELARLSPATFSRLLAGNDSEYVPDTATVTAIAEWLQKKLSEFEPTARPSHKTLADVEVHLNALPDLSRDDAKFIMSVVKLLYDEKRNRPKRKR